LISARFRGIVELGTTRAERKQQPSQRGEMQTNYALQSIYSVLDAFAHSSDFDLITSSHQDEILSVINDLETLLEVD
jgi:hypothetical protein